MTDSTKPIVQGWCPGAHRPMMSGDGLVVRVRPFRASLDRDQVYGLCDLARRFGNGTVDLTSRANLQIRGVSAVDHPALLADLDGLGLLDKDPAVEGHRNILMPVDWQVGDLTDRLYTGLLETLATLPALPQKMGYALDTGATASLIHGSADFRFELDAQGHLILRADGAATGRRVTEDTAMQALLGLVSWFIDSGGQEAGRMKRHVRSKALPDSWQGVKPRAVASALAPGAHHCGAILGVPFGSMNADDLQALMGTQSVTELRLMLGRMIWLRGADPRNSRGFVTVPNSPLLTTHACPGAPLCPQGSVETRALARRLAGRVNGTLHISGCAKGCAHPRRADVTLVGQDGRFDLVRDGAPWDEPDSTGLEPNDLTDLTESAAHAL